jgi:hypothetical protein
MSFLAQIYASAKAAGLEIQDVMLGGTQDLEPIFAGMASGGVDALAVQPTLPRAPIERPKAYNGRIFYEGELGVVIGKKCSMVSEAEAAPYVDKILKGANQRICRSSSQRNSGWSSISRPQRRWAFPCCPRC